MPNKDVLPRRCFHGQKYKPKTDMRDELKKLTDYLREQAGPRTTTQITSDIGMPRRTVYALVELFPRAIVNEPETKCFTTLRVRLHESMLGPGDDWRDKLRQKERYKDMAMRLIRSGACIG